MAKENEEMGTMRKRRVKGVRYGRGTQINLL